MLAGADMVIGEIVPLRPEALFFYGRQTLVAPYMKKGRPSTTRTAQRAKRRRAPVPGSPAIAAPSSAVTVGFASPPCDGFAFFEALLLYPFWQYSIVPLESPSSTRKIFGALGHFVEDAYSFFVKVSFPPHCGHCLGLHLVSFSNPQLLHL